MQHQDSSFLTMTTHDLSMLFSNHQGQSGDDLMAAISRFIDTLQKTINDVEKQIRGARSIDTLKSSINHPLELALRFSCSDLVQITNNLNSAFKGVTNISETELTPNILSHIFVWVGIASQTLSATKMLFHLSVLNGRAPNGEPIKQAGVWI